VVDQDGTIYVGAGTPGTGHLYAITPQGTVQWQSPRLEAAPSTPALGPDGTVYVGTEDFGRPLYALDPRTGAITGTVALSDPVHAITVLENGTLYVTSERGFLYALQPDLREHWRVPLGMAAAAPVVGRDGTIYVVAPGLQAYHPNGTLHWARPLGNAGIVVAPSGTLYAAGNGRAGAPGLTAFAPDGTPLWGAALPVAVCGAFAQLLGVSLPGIAPDGALIVGVMGAQRPGVGGGSGTIQAFNADGSPRWTFCPATVGDTIDTAPIIDRDGQVYFITGPQGRVAPKTLYALRPDGSEHWSAPLGSVVGDGLALGPGRLYVTTQEQEGVKLVAFGAVAVPDGPPTIAISPTAGPN
jgi:outer membrane protein assembly factor BamB